MDNLKDMKIKMLEAEIAGLKDQLKRASEYIKMLEAHADGGAVNNARTDYQFEKAHGFPHADMPEETPYSKLEYISNGKWLSRQQIIRGRRSADTLFEFLAEKVDESGEVYLDIQDTMHSLRMSQSTLHRARVELERVELMKALPTSAKTEFGCRLPTPDEMGDLIARNRDTGAKRANRVLYKVRSDLRSSQD